MQDSQDLGMLAAFRAQRHRQFTQALLHAGCQLRCLAA
jgi:hypothetical protein